MDGFGAQFFFTFCNSSELYVRDTLVTNFCESKSAHPNTLHILSTADNWASLFSVLDRMIYSEQATIAAAKAIK
jgi:hypothetical protein